MTITEFILARVAEDEASLKNATDYECWNGVGRELAEIEAKRRIVREHSEDHNCVRYIHPDDNRDCYTLGVLAAVYSDHPDYRAAWPGGDA